MLIWCSNNYFHSQHGTSARRRWWVYECFVNINISWISDIQANWLYLLFILASFIYMFVNVYISTCHWQHGYDMHPIDRGYLYTFCWGFLDMLPLPIGNVSIHLYKEQISFRDTMWSLLPKSKRKQWTTSLCGVG